MVIWHQFVTSFISPKSIVKFVNTRMVTVFGYVTFLMLITLIPAGIMTSTVISNTVSQFQQYVSGDDIPDFTLQNGVLTSDQAEPIVTEGDTDRFIFDTTGQFRPQDIIDGPPTFAILSEQLIIKNNDRTQIVNYKDFQELQLTKTQVVRFVDTLAGMKWIFIVIFLFISFTFLWALKLFGITFVALIGIALNHSLHNKIPFARLWVLSAYAVTLPTVTDRIFATFGIAIPFWLVIYLIGCLVILYIVLRELSYIPKDYGVPAEATETTEKMEASTVESDATPPAKIEPPTRPE
jgi:hypothetical protein